MTCLLNETRYDTRFEAQVPLNGHSSFIRYRPISFSIHCVSEESTTIQRKSH